MRFVGEGLAEVHFAWNGNWGPAQALELLGHFWKVAVTYIIGIMEKKMETTIMGYIGVI